MKISVNQKSFLSKFALAMLAVLSVAFFVVPSTTELKALDTNSHICFKTVDPVDYQRAYVNGTAEQKCPPASENWDLYDAPTSTIGMCLEQVAGKGYEATNPRLDVNGNPILDSTKTKCLDKDGDATGLYKSFSSITKQYSPPGVIMPPINSNGNSNNGNGNGNNNNSGGNSNNGGSGGPGGGTSANTTQGDCEDGFHKTGPLCIPNNPFPNNSIAGGDATASGLATRLIRILLYFAAIVAVIMAIIGGYKVMTAGGNAAQASDGRKTLTNALIGLGITILAYVIVQAVVSFLTT